MSSSKSAPLGMLTSLMNEGGSPWDDPSVAVTTDSSLLVPVNYFYEIGSEEISLFADKTLTTPAPNGWYLENRAGSRWIFMVKGGIVLSHTEKIVPELTKFMIYCPITPACKARQDGTPVLVWAKLMPPQINDYIYMDAIGNARLDSGTYWCESHKHEGHVFTTSEVHSRDKQIGQVVTVIDCSGGNLK